MVAKSTKEVGVVTAGLIDYLHKQLGSNMNLIHLIGHSLGAHVAGFAGKFAQHTVERISGRLSKYNSQKDTLYV